MKTANTLMMIFFLGAAVVQYNDPDPTLWMTIYGMAAAVCALFFQTSRPFPKKTVAVFALLCVFGSFFHLVRHLLMAKGFEQEIIFESVGLLIVGWWCKTLTMKRANG